MSAFESIHRASQYVATMAVCFAVPERKGRHLGFTWDASESSLVSAALNDEGLTLQLNLQVYALDVVHPQSGLSGSYPLTGARHFDIIQWLDHEREFCGIKQQYSFEPTVELPYEPELNDHFSFPSLSGDQLDDVIESIRLAHDSLTGAADHLQVYPELFIQADTFDYRLHVGESEFIGVDLIQKRGFVKRGEVSQEIEVESNMTASAVAQKLIMLRQSLLSDSLDHGQ